MGRGNKRKYGGISNKMMLQRDILERLHRIKSKAVTGQRVYWDLEKLIDDMKRG